MSLLPCFYSQKLQKLSLDLLLHCSRCFPLVLSPKWAAILLSRCILCNADSLRKRGRRGEDTLHVALTDVYTLWQKLIKKANVMTLLTHFFVLLVFDLIFCLESEKELFSGPNVRSWGTISTPVDVALFFIGKGKKCSNLSFFSVTSGEDNASGMLEGILRGQKGFFPSQCVQEVRLRNPHSVKQGAITTAPRNSISGQGTGNKANPSSTAVVNPVGNGVGGNLDNANLSANQRHFATAQRPKDFM